MRKWLFVFLVIGLLCIVTVYIFIPSEILISTVDEVESTDRIVADYLNSGSNRLKWWPSDLRSVKPAGDSSVLNYAGYNFMFKNPDFNSSEILITDDNLIANSVVTWGQSGKNLLKVNWKVSILTSSNPVKRLFQYLQGYKLKRDITSIMERLLGFIVESRNIYGIEIQITTVRDTILAASTSTSANYPDIKQIYKRIDWIKAYIEKTKARQVSPPMLNIHTNEHGAFETTLAIPIDNEIAPGNSIVINRMVAGNILSADVHGGPKTIADAFDKMRLYIKDFKLVSPAMPFESLVTDRLAQPDTSKWVTKIYYPIF